MSANFTPDMGVFRDLRPFRFWCQKVLPLVYDDSLSYYELLAKVVDYLNQTMEDVETLHSDVTNLRTAYTQLQDYVNHYFDNLDVQEEINQKLDDMASSGALTSLLTPYIGEIVTQWLEENITPTTPVIDKSLTVKDAGADALVVGINFRELGKKILVNKFDYSTLIPDKYIDSGGVIRDFEGWSLSGYLEVEPNTRYGLFTDGAIQTNLYVSYFNEGLEVVGGIYGADYFTTTANTKYIRISALTDKFKATSIIANYSLTHQYPFRDNIPYLIELTNTPASDGNDHLVRTANVYNKDYLVNGYYVATPQGYMTPFTTWSTTGFCPVEEDVPYSVVINKNDYATNLYVTYFDENLEAIGGVFGGVDEFTPPTGCKYVRVSMETVKFTDETMILPTELCRYLPIEFIPYGYVTDGAYSEEYHDYDKSIRSICRMGFDVYNPSTPPQQSLASYREAYKRGFRIMLCDLLFTSDNVPVCWHDHYLNQYTNSVYTNDGTLVPSDPAIYINSVTYDDLRANYDFGLAKGETYRGTRIMSLDEMCALAKKLGVELYIECKELDTQEQANIAVRTAKKNGILDRTSWSGSVTQMNLILNAYSKARVGIETIGTTVANVDTALTLRRGENEVFIFGTGDNNASETIMNYLMANDMPYEMGTINGATELLTYANSAIGKLCSGIESDRIIAGKVLLLSEV